MGKILTLTLALLAPTFAHAAPFEDQHGAWWDLPLPPMHYFDEPYTGRLDIKHLPEAEILSICRQANGKAENFGCAFPTIGRCSVYVSEELPKLLREHVQIHEVAHCHGWPADHPQR